VLASFVRPSRRPDSKSPWRKISVARHDLYVLQSHIVLLMHALAIEVIDHFVASGYKRTG
jgi:hypothetical protein